MSSKWSKVKNKAILLRKSGESIRQIEKETGVARSTLSGWFKNIVLTKSQVKKLQTRAKFGLKLARKKAVEWHNKEKELRIQKAYTEACDIIKLIDLTNKPILELSLAMLYWGEGTKANTTSLGNSNPLILKFFLKSIESLYTIERSKIKCDLHLRSDQNEKEAIKYWSGQLNIPQANFSAIKDKRIVKSRTYSYYKGVCVIQCGRIAIQRRLVHLAEEFSKIIVEN